MAIVSVGSLGTATSTAADQSSLVLTTTATLEANNLGVLIVAVDNNQTTDGDEGAVTGVTDSAGNVWTKGGEFTNGQAAAQAGATCSIWYKRVTTQLNSGGTITISFSNNTSRDAAAAAAWEYTVGSAVVLEGTPGTLAADNAQPGSLDVTTSNLSCLRIRGIAAERGAGVTLTVTAGWTELTGAIANTGTNNTSMIVRGEFIISTGTSSASDPTAANTADMASVYIALREAGTDTILTAAAGSYAVTGVSTNWLLSMAAAVGAYALTGVATAWALTMNAVKGAYTYTGVATVWALTMNAVTGSYILTGVAATLQAILTMAAAAGSYTYTGIASFAGWAIGAGTGSYALNGVAVIWQRSMNAVAGAYTLTGIAAVLSWGRYLIAAAGSYTLAGLDALQKISINAAVGAYTYTGVAATLQSIRSMIASGGTYVYTGMVAGLGATRTLVAAAGTYVYTGVAITMGKLSRAVAYHARRRVDAFLTGLRVRAPSLTKLRSVAPGLSKKRTDDPSLFK